MLFQLEEFNEVSECCGADTRLSEDSIWYESICLKCGSQCQLIDKETYDRLHSFINQNQLKLFNDDTT